MIKLSQEGGTALFVIVLLLVLGGAGYYLYQEAQKDESIDSFAGCVAAGGAIQESYPEVCAINGHSFPNPNQSFEQPQE